MLKQVNGPADCTAGVYLEPAWDPVRREATYRQSPHGPALLAGTAYRLTAYIALTADAWGFRTFDGTSLARPQSFDFGVGGESAPYDTVSTAEHFCEGPRPTCTSDCQTKCAAICAGEQCAHDCVEPCVAACPRSVADMLGAAGCGQGGCHRGSTAPESLDTSSAAGLASAIGRVANESQTGEQASMPDESPSRFGRAMPLVDPGVPGNSWLVYKLLASPSLRLEVPFPDRAEIRRVQRTIITGMPMPPSNAPGAALRDGEPEWLADWILQGAPVRSCP